MNRRGYSAFVFCRECGFVCRCQRCSVSMTYHQQPEGLRCHYCDARADVPESCPDCHGPYIRHFGAGTQQIEESAHKLFPEARIVRLDRDTTSRKGSHERLLDAYPERALSRIWKAQHFSWWMTSMLHTSPGATDFDLRRRIGELRSVVESEHGRAYLAEAYTGWPLAR